MMNLLRITADEATLAVIAEACFRAGLATRLGAADFAEAADFGWQRDPAVNKRTGKPLSPNRYISTGPTPKAGTVRYFKTPPKGLEGGSPQPAEQATEPPAEAQPVEQVPIPAHVRDTAEMLRSMSKQDLTDEKMAELQTMLAGTGGRTGWSVADLKALKQQLGVSAYGNKSEMAQRIIAGAKKNAADRGAELLPVDEPPPAGPAISEPPPVGAASPEAPPAAEAPPVGEPAPAGPTAGPPPAGGPSADAYLNDTTNDRAKDRQPWEMTREELEQANPALHDKIMDRFSFGIGFDPAYGMYLAEAMNRGLDVPLSVRKKYLADHSTKLTKTGERPVGFHELTQSEYESQMRQLTASNNRWRKVDSQFDPAQAREAHRRYVEQALAAGKPVPPEVLADYPDLAPAAGGPSPDDLHGAFRDLDARGDNQVRLDELARDLGATPEQARRLGEQHGYYHAEAEGGLGGGPQHAGFLVKRDRASAPPAPPPAEAMPAETPTSPAASAPLHERIAHLVNNGGSEADLRSAMKELGDLNTADRLELARAVASATGRSFTGTNKMAVTAKLGAWMRDAVDRSSGIDRNNNARPVRSLEEDYGPQGETAEGTSPPKSPADLVREIASDADSSKDAVHGFYQHLDGLAGSLDERGKAALLQELGGQYTGNFHEDVRRAFPDHDIPSRKQFERDEKKYRDRLHEMGRGIDELSRVGRAPKTEKASGPPVPTPRASTPPAPPAEADSPAPERDRQWAASQQRERGQSPLPAGAAPEKDEAPLQAALQHFRHTRGRPYVMKLAEAARKALAAGQSSAQFIASQGKALRPEDARMARVLYRSMRQQGASFELLEALGRIADGEATFDALAPFLGDDHAIPAD